MPPKNTLSARDIEVVAAAFQCLKTPPDVRHIYRYMRSSDSYPPNSA
jgi:hypothetical protein